MVEVRYWQARVGWKARILKMILRRQHWAGFLVGMPIAMSWACGQHCGRLWMWTDMGGFGRFPSAPSLARNWSKPGCEQG